MNRIIQICRWEMTLQYRYGVYLAALIVTAVWAILMAPLNHEYQLLFVPFILFIDLAILGFYFMGSMVLFDKGQKTIQALVVTPLRIGVYFFSKIVTFALLSVAASMLLVLFTYGFAKVNIGLLIMGIVSNSVIYTLIGFIAISGYDSISDYLIPSWFYLLLTQLPLIDYFHLIPKTPWLHWLFFLHPTQGPLYLMKAAFTESEIIQTILSIGIVGVWFGIFLRIAFQAFKRKILEQQTR